MYDNQSKKDQKVGALSGLRIIDLTRILAGPTCTQLLADLGADVIKVEKPGLGDDTRSWGPPFVTDAKGEDTRESAYFLCANRNKRSVAIDIAKREGAALLRNLLSTADVLIENFKVGDLARYGLSYDDLKGEFPNIVYCSITGFGQTGPNATKSGYDILAQGYGGIMSITGEPDGDPMKVAVGITDVMTGMYAATAIMAALRFRDATGLGQQIDIALVDVQISWLVNEGVSYLLTGKPPVRRGNQHPSIVPYQVYEVADGHVIVAVGNDSQFERFCGVIGLPGLAADPRFSTNENRMRHREKLVHKIASALRPIGKEPLVAALEAHSIPGGPINTLPEVFASDQALARDMKISLPHPDAGSGAVDLIGNPLKMSLTPITYRCAPPTCGADTDCTIREILGEAALSNARAAGALG